MEDRLPIRMARAVKHELRRQATGPVRLRRRFFRPGREFRRIARRHERVLQDPTFSLLTWESHQPVLIELLRRHPGARMLELGVGYSSTPIVLQLSGSSVSLETDADWLER